MKLPVRLNVERVYHATDIALSSFSHGAIFPLSRSGNAAYRVLQHRSTSASSTRTPGSGSDSSFLPHPAVNCDKLDVTSSCFSFGPLRRSAVARYQHRRHPTVNWPSLSGVGARCPFDKAAFAGARNGPRIYKTDLDLDSLFSRKLIARYEHYITIRSDVSRKYNGFFFTFCAWIYKCFAI